MRSIAKHDTTQTADCSTHYPSWRTEFPTAAPRFQPGGFGENLVTARMNERNVCIGDTVALGSDPAAGALLQVSLPRQPCFKLNHRFELKNFAPNTWRLSRTGWYYRVLREGWVAAGDEMRVVARPHPDWTIERVQEYLHRNTADGAMNELLAGIEEMGKESRDAFASRVAKQKARARRAAEKADEASLWRDFRLVEKTRQTPRIMSFVLEAVEAVGDAHLSEGAHAKVKIPVMGAGGEPLVRAYSVVSGDKNRLEFGISLEDNSRGASKFLHQTARIGDILPVGRLTSMPFVSAASCHVFVAGGVGITAFLPLLESLRHLNFAAQLHYAVRAADELPFRARLARLGRDVVTVYDGARGQRLRIPHLLRTMPWNSRVYVCGPPRMMDEARVKTRAAGLGDDEVHFEAFAADASGDPFSAVVTNRGEAVVEVGAEETLLEVLRRRFGVDDVPSSCEVGNCGTCKIKVRDGRVEHRGTALAEEEKADTMLSCVSRGLGRIAVEI